MRFSTKEEIMGMPEFDFNGKIEIDSELDTNVEAQLKAELSFSLVHVVGLG